METHIIIITVIFVYLMSWYGNIIYSYANVSDKMVKERQRKNLNRLSSCLIIFVISLITTNIFQNGEIETMKRLVGIILISFAFYATRFNIFVYRNPFHYEIDTVKNRTKLGKIIHSSYAYYIGKIVGLIIGILLTI